MPEHTIDFDGETLTVPSSRDNYTVAITEYELREVANRMPGGLPVPVQVHGFDVDEVLVIKGEATGGLQALTALARLRPALSRPEVKEPQNDAQAPLQAQEAASAPGGDPRLDDLAESLQQRVEAFVSNLGVDPHKYDHQNVAGELVSATLGILRNHGYLPEPVSVMDSPAGSRSLRQATRDGYLTQRDQVERALDRALEGQHRLRDRAMRELDEVLAR